MRVRALEPIPLSEISAKNNLLQTAYWSRVKARFGWRALAFRCSAEGESGDSDFDLLLLMRKLALGWSFAYCPHGPDIQVNADSRGSFLESITSRLRPHLPKRCVFLRYDLPWTTLGGESGVECLVQAFRKAVVDVQPPDTVMVDLSPSETEILGKMKSKTRYNIRLAEKKGVRITKGSVADLPLWYDLAQETAKRDRITLHSLAYFETLFSESKGADDPQPHLLLAAAEGETLAAVIMTLHRENALYHFGASSNSHRNLMPTYALQWKAMLLAKSKNATNYDLFGIPRENKPDDPKLGLYRFKIGFGGEVVHRLGCWDAPIDPLVYRIFRAAEKLRAYYYFRIRK